MDFSFDMFFQFLPLCFVKDLLIEMTRKYHTDEKYREITKKSSRRQYLRLKALKK